MHARRLPLRAEARATAGFGGTQALRMCAVCCYLRIFATDFQGSRDTEASSPCPHQCHGGCSRPQHEEAHAARLPKATKRRPEVLFHHVDWFRCMVSAHPLCHRMLESGLFWPILTVAGTPNTCTYWGHDRPRPPRFSIQPSVIQLQTQQVSVTEIAMATEPPGQNPEKVPQFVHLCLWLLAAGCLGKGPGPLHSLMKSPATVLLGNRAWHTVHRTPHAMHRVLRTLHLCRVPTAQPGRAGRKLLCGGGMARKPICPTPPLPLLGRLAGRGVWAGAALPAVPGGGGGSDPNIHGSK